MRYIQRSIWRWRFLIACDFTAWRDWMIIAWVFKRHSSDLFHTYMLGRMPRASK